MERAGAVGVAVEGRVMNDDIEARVIGVVRRVWQFAEASRISSEFSLESELSSIEIVAFVTEASKEFRIEYGDRVEDWDALRTVADFSEWVEQRVSKSL
jgi:acyl carrier protein